MKRDIDINLARQLIGEQFPQWAALPLRELPESGWDNRTFRLGDDLLIRLPSAEHYVAQVDVEQHWLPKLAAWLPQPIPTPVATGAACATYPWPWSIYRWIPGSTVATGQIDSLDDLARDCAQFLLALQQVPSDDGPVAGIRNFHRGGLLSVYDQQARQAISALPRAHDRPAIDAIWDAAVRTKWQQQPVWVHGDFSPRNLLISKGRLSGVIDFGQLGIGDPACDLTIAWTVFDGGSHSIFRKHMDLDAETWLRGKAWVVWKAAILASRLVSGPPDDVLAADKWLSSVIDDD